MSKGDERRRGEEGGIQGGVRKLNGGEGEERERKAEMDVKGENRKNKYIRRRVNLKKKLSRKKIENQNE